MTHELIVELQARADSYRRSGPSAEHTAALLDRAAVAISSLLSEQRRAEVLQAAHKEAEREAAAWQRRAEEAERVARLHAQNEVSAMGRACDERARAEAANRRAEEAEEAQRISAGEALRWKSARDIQESRAEAAEAQLQRLRGRVEQLERALTPFAKFNLDGFFGEVLEVVPASPYNPSRRIEPIWTSHFRRARNVLSSTVGMGEENRTSNASRAATRDHSLAAPKAGHSAGGGNV